MALITLQLPLSSASLAGGARLAGGKITSEADTVWAGVSQYGGPVFDPDNQHVWYGHLTNNKIVKRRISDGAIIQNLTPSGGQPTGFHRSDSTSLYVALYPNTTHAIGRIDFATPSVINYFDFAPGSTFHVIKDPLVATRAWGRTIYTGNYQEFDLSTGVLTGRVTPGGYANGGDATPGFLWIALEQQLLKIRESDNTVVETWDSSPTAAIREGASGAAPESTQHGWQAITAGLDGRPMAWVHHTGAIDRFKATGGVWPAAPPFPQFENRILFPEEERGGGNANFNFYSFAHPKFSFSDDGRYMAFANWDVPISSISATIIVRNIQDQTATWTHTFADNVTVKGLDIPSKSKNTDTFTYTTFQYSVGAGPFVSFTPGTPLNVSVGGGQALTVRVTFNLAEKPGAAELPYVAGDSGEGITILYDDGVPGVKIINVPPEIVYVPAPEVIPAPPTTAGTEARGIFQSDVIIRTALLAAFADMRKNPWLLDSAFANLRQDDLTLKDYGDLEIARAKEWFLNNEIQVRLDIDPNPPKFPCVSVLLAQSTEEENTIADVHYQTSEGLAQPWPVLVGPFVPKAYDLATGVMKLPDSVTFQSDIAPGMVLLDRIGQIYTINDVRDATTIVIDPGITADFGDVVVKAAQPAYGVTIESASFREMYSIGCAVESEPVHLVYLHSIVTFALLRYREDLLEARGFERSSLASTETRKNPVFDTEHVFSRYIAITGFVRQYWPKRIKARIASMKTQLVVDAGSSAQIASGPGTPPADDLTWLAEQDALAVTTPLKK